MIIVARFDWLISNEHSVGSCNIFKAISTSFSPIMDWFLKKISPFSNQFQTNFWPVFGIFFKKISSVFLAIFDQFLSNFQYIFQEDFTNFGSVLDQFWINFLTSFWPIPIPSSNFSGATVLGSRHPKLNRIGRPFHKQSAIAINWWNNQ